ncbi:MAG: hypothetical protein KDA88_07980 [Planctomycetaceae bacterium]|nr:hypothetical protein [Planctomycetaceae bacterium]
MWNWDEYGDAIQGYDQGIGCIFPDNPPRTDSNMNVVSASKIGYGPCRSSGDSATACHATTAHT